MHTPTRAHTTYARAQYKGNTAVKVARVTRLAFCYDNVSKHANPLTLTGRKPVCS